MENMEEKIEEEAKEMAIEHVQKHPPFYGQIPQLLLRDKELNHLPKLIFGVMHSMAPEKELKKNIVLEIAMKTLGEALGVSADRIRLGIDELEDRGWIKRTRQGKRIPNMYVLYPMKKKDFQAIKGMRRVHLRLKYDYELAKRLKASLYE